MIFEELFEKSTVTGEQPYISMASEQLKAEKGVVDVGLYNIYSFQFTHTIHINIIWFTI